MRLQKLTKLPISQRVEDLVSRLTLDEKISQLVDTAPAIPRLGIPAYEWWSEALHGVAVQTTVRQGIRFNGTIRFATSFPQVILTAASFDAHLWYRIGQVIGKEARGIYNAGQATGMTFWAPNINIFRDPRWGRGQETPGEDPLVTGKYAVSYVRGVQGDSFEGGTLGEQLQASACCKHFTAYDLDNWKGMNRFIFDAQVTLQDLADTYQPPFQSCIQEGKASGIMCAYNRVNGVPNCADYNLLSKKARGQWGFYGYITSDCDAVSIIHDDQGYAKSPEDAVADVLKAGMDVNCGDYLKNYTKSAVKKKILPESEIDRALHNLFSIRMRLGLFNGNPTKQPYGNIAPNQVCSREHQALALQAAQDGIVLLKNSDRLLPLSKLGTKSLAVIGPNANNSTILLGNYFGPPCKTVTPLQGLQNYIKNTRYHPGCSRVACSSASTNQAVKIAKGADQVILVMGTGSNSREGGPRSFEPAAPREAAGADNCCIKSCKKTSCSGEAGGTALAQIIFGDHNPGGRLPMTWYPQDFTKVPMTDMRMRPQPSSGYPGRTYRFYNGKKVFEFGYGLSYSNYSYELASDTQNKLHLRASSNQLANNSNTTRQKLISDIGKELCEKNKFTVTVGVKNHGEMAGKHPVLLFVRQAKVGNGRPIKKLVGFQTVNLNAGENAEIEYELSPCEHLSSPDDRGLMVMEEGSQFLIVGDKEYPITIIF
ncbi:SUGAR HYDROLASE-RELATED [Salix viminalis]|uniref:SUGAR HYDROLASE-RELATED n=1 Tax=Salix viminalis TaxID=40686 RepID=A0A9Q0ZDJ8_SALVM|nr:SUGAR HYDROLASE-RELATED [Salix viminalis]